MLHMISFDEEQLIEVTESDDVVDSFKANGKNKLVKVVLKNGVKTVIAITCFATYFTVTQTGGAGLEHLFHLPAGPAFIPVLVLGVLASLTATAFYFRAMDEMRLVPRKISEASLLVFTPFAAAPIFTGAYLGAQNLNLPIFLCIINAFILLFIRFSILWDGAIKCPVKLKDIKNSLIKAYEERDVLNFIRLISGSALTVGYSVSLSDSIYAASQIILSWVYIPSKLIPFIAYIASGCGVIGTIPYTLYWLSLGFDMLTNGKNFEGSKTDRYTYIAALMSIPSIIGIFGTTTSASGQVFAKLGIFAMIIRFISSVGYGVAVNTIAFSGITREIGKKLPNPFFKCRQCFFASSSSAEKIPLNAQELESYGSQSMLLVS
ncbi:MAG: hypothetical protein Tsb005_14260 [Gammaproteobacteria bacterium]